MSHPVIAINVAAKEVKKKPLGDGEPPHNEQHEQGAGGTWKSI